MDKNSLIHQSAAEFLAAAALDVFPGTLLLGGQGTSKYFYYDFIFPCPFSKETMPLVEERMVRLLKEQKEIFKREMVPTNAAGLFQARGQPQIVAKLNEIEEGLAQICEIDSFVDYCPYPFSKKWPWTPHVKLFHLEESAKDGKKIMRIVGAVSPDKTTLKNLIKTAADTPFHHGHFVKEMQLLQPLGDGLWSWLPKGEQLRQHLLSLWRGELLKENFKFISTPYLCSGASGEEALVHYHQDCFTKLGCDALAEIAYFPTEEIDVPDGLLKTKGAFTDRFTRFFPEENFLNICISSLHFILKMPRILGFEFQVVLGLSSRYKSAEHSDHHRLLRAALEKVGLEYEVEKGYRKGCESWIEIRISDALGRLWGGPFMSILQKRTERDRITLSGSSFGPMERLVGLMLERHKGNIPTWLTPTQVRLIPLNEEARHYASQVLGKLAAEGIRCETDKEAGDLGKRLYQAIQERIPFVVILGDRELKAQTLVVRAYGAEQEERMTVDALCERIKVVNTGVDF